jgi:hypothetical protein
MAISLFFHYVYREETPHSYRTMPMSRPPQCAALLKRYLADAMDKAKSVSSTNKWESHPEGTLNKVQFTIKSTTSLGNKKKAPDAVAQSGL